MRGHQSGFLFDVVYIERARGGAGAIHEKDQGGVLPGGDEGLAHALGAVDEALHRIVGKIKAQEFPTRTAVVHRYFVLALPVHPAFELHKDGHGHVRPHFHEDGLVRAAEVYRGAQGEGAAFPVGARIGNGAHFGCYRVCPAGVGIFHHLIAGPVEGAEGIVHGRDIKGDRQAYRV